MGGGHHSSGERFGSAVGGPLTHLDPAAKVLAALAVVVAVVTVPRQGWWAFAALGMLIGAIAVIAEVPPRRFGRGLVVEAPFLAFALLMPVVGRGPRRTVLGIPLSTAGLGAGGDLLARGTLGVATALVLASTTSTPEMLGALDRLRLPRPLVAIATFMIRYLDVVAGELARMRVARISRGDDPRWLWQARAVAATAGTLFVRCYERGERVHLAMLSRGYDGSLPLGPSAATRRWPAALAPAAALAIVVTAHLT